MNFEDKEKAYSNISWIEQNMEGNILEIRNKLISVFQLLLEDDGYQMTRYQAFNPEGKFMIISPFDFSAVNKNDTSDKIGIIYDKGTEPLQPIALNMFVHNAKQQSVPRTIILRGKPITIKERALIFNSFPYVVEIIDFYFLRNWLSKKETSIENVNEISVLLKALNDRVAKIISEQPDQLNQLEWRDLERLVAGILEEFNFEVELTPGSKDGGKDIILICRNNDSRKSYIIEVKHWRSGHRVGQSFVKDFFNVIINEKHDKGLYLSTYGYTDNAFEALTEVERKKVRFGEKEKIISLCKFYTKKRSGIWIPEKSNEELLFEETN